VCVCVIVFVFDVCVCVCVFLCVLFPDQLKISALQSDDEDLREDESSTSNLMMTALTFEPDSDTMLWNYI